MADPLSCLRKQYVRKIPITERNDQIIFEEYSWPKTVKTNYVVKGSGKDGTPKEYYTLESLVFFLKNRGLSHPVYCKKAAAENIPAVRRPDRKDILDYLSGKMNTAFGIDKSAPIEVPTAGKRKNSEPASPQKLKLMKLSSESKDAAVQETRDSKCVSSLFSSIVCKSISKAENFDVVKKLSEEVKKIAKISNENAYDIIFSAALNSNIEDLIDLRFTNRTASGVSFFCEFFIGATKIAVGEGENRYFAKSKASENALYILKNLREPPEDSKAVVQRQRDKGSATQDGVKESFSSNASDAAASSESDPNLSQSTREKDILMRLAFDMQRGMRKRKCPHDEYVNCFHNSASRLGFLDDVVYKISEDRSAPKNINMYLCDLFVKNTLVGQGEGGKVKLARKEAAASGYKYLMKLIESDPEEPNSGKEASKGGTPNVKDEDAPACFKSSFEELAHNDAIKNPFSLNKELLNNSFRLQLLIFDRSEQVACGEVRETVTLSLSAKMCRKRLSYNFVSNDDGTVRCEVSLDCKVVGTGVGEGTLDAKFEAARDAVDSLKKQVYTLKIKPGIEEGLHVNRRNLLELKSDSPKKMLEWLKIVGWSGIGKEQKFSEPIGAGAVCAGEMDLKSKIEVLLEEYSKSDVIMPLLFSRDFTESERGAIQGLAKQKDFFCMNYGKSAATPLIVKRRLSVSELLGSILKEGGRTSRYELMDMSAT